MTLRNAKRPSPKRTAAAAVALSLLAGGCDDTPQSEGAAEPLARPVSYMTLEKVDPSRQSVVAGSVESWKKELIGFQVGGRVETVREPGANIRGRLVDGAGKVVEAGTLIGSVENKRFELRVAEAQARVGGAEAEHGRARTELKRQERLLAKGASAQKRVDTARAAFKTTRARLIEAREALRQAQVDAADTKLYAPFDGQISRIHVIPGGYAEKGQPVATVQMMDPMKVQVAVSPDTDGAIKSNNLMNVYVDGVERPLAG